MKLIRKTKIFSKRAIPPPADFFEVPNEWNTNKPMKVKVRGTKKYNREFSSLRNIDSRKILLKALIQDLKSGYITVDGPPHTNLGFKVGDIDTHHLNDFSKKYHFRKLIYSKSISPSDRLVYSIEKPYFDEETGEIVTPIQIHSCLGHQEPDSYRTYSNTD